MSTLLFPQLIMSETVGSSVSCRGGVTRPSPLACTECRKRHLKCDASLPACSRCAGTGLECLYMPSRRGYRGPSKRKSDHQHVGSHKAAPPPFVRRASTISDQASEWTLFPPAEGVTPGFNSEYHFQATPSADTLPGSLPIFSNSENTPLQQTSTHEARRDGSTDIDDNDDDLQLINLYYANFQAAHPILVPRVYYSAQTYPKYLRLVVKFIGSHFSTSVSSDSLRSSTGSSLESQNVKSPSLVQALLLFAIALHSRNEVKEAQSVLARGVTLALELGMNRKDYATINGRQQAVVEESLRRTWWELYVLDGFTAALHRKSGFRSSQVELDAPLPCEENVYIEGICIPNPPTVAQFDGRLFADEEIQFSSFCYRIEAVRILSRVLSIAGTDEIHEDQIQAVDNALAGWAHHLPPAKTDIVNSFGEVDEMLFQAHMIIQCANIFLHFPRSDLLSTLPGTADIVCARGGKQMSPATTQHIHAVKATDASKELSNLAALRLPVQKHTPFFVCGLVICAIVQLSACSVHACHCMEQHRDRVVLIIGILKSLSQHWTIASMVMQQIKKVGAEVLQVCAKPAPSSTDHYSSRDSGVDVNVSLEDISWFDLFESQGLACLPPFDAHVSFAQPP